MINQKLKFCSWNIEGFKSRKIGIKLQYADFTELLHDIDFVALTETHIHSEILEDLQIPGFQLLAFKNRVKNKKSGLAPGGIAVFVREHLAKLFSV